MRPIIKKRITESDNVTRIELTVFGICVYASECIDKIERSHRPIGFVQYPIEAPSEVADEDYYPEEY